MTRLVFHIDRKNVPDGPDGDTHVWLYGSNPPYEHVGTVGARAYEAATRLSLRPSRAAMDLLSIGMAVTAADTFILRADEPDGWRRTFEMRLPLSEPERWIPLKAHLEATLRFLSSDLWNFEFTSGGMEPPPISEIKRRNRVVNLAKVDCAALFSGGLDSAIGALDLIAQGIRPLLVSHASRGDADKQDIVAGLLPSSCERMSVNTYPTWAGADDDSQRTRSFQFLVLGALAAEAIAHYRKIPQADLFVCENGLIALNPPLTPRRLGSHSTRTAHPHFLSSFQALLDGARIPVAVSNPYRHVTKGEMATPHAAQGTFSHFATETVSCGKWKRRNQQCGRCVPCIIRRASMHAAGVHDTTDYQYPDLQAVMTDEDGRDDLIAMQAALIRGVDAERHVMYAGPLPIAAADRQAYIDVAKRGMDEIRRYLASEGFAV
ncbi:Qat anti-phage system QueC-like protein QatC [Parvibaculum sp.]|uniref:Qat anti-phage system QueC-like protein QatC n=1 Tax=Parvibaculum sp. TaxID=2024848 RepID=UPI00391A5A40